MNLPRHHSQRLKTNQQRGLPLHFDLLFRQDTYSFVFFGKLSEGGTMQGDSTGTCKHLMATRRAKNINRMPRAIGDEFARGCRQKMCAYLSTIPAGHCRPPGRPSVPGTEPDIKPLQGGLVASHSPQKKRCVAGRGISERKPVWIAARAKHLYLRETALFTVLFTVPAANLHPALAAPAAPNRRLPP